MPRFSDLDLIEPLQRALDGAGYDSPTPIQERSIPLLLEGRDLLGCAQTGTGKTAAFTLPVLQHLAESRPARGRRKIRALILTPTRELAIQIGESIETYGAHLSLRHTVIFGGVKEGRQIRVLERGIDILVATPGRLLDLNGRGFIDLSTVEFFVLDEADRMLDMGFIHDVRRVLKELPSKRQSLLFSATMPAKIVELAGSFLHDPASVEVTPTATTVERIDQEVMFVEKADKKKLLIDLLRGDEVESAIVFTRTKHGANRLAKQLSKAGLEAAAIHGNKSQNARQRALEGFRRGDVVVLVATDLASRGIDIDDVTHVFNYELPNEPDSYVHRIGRTGRAGRAGAAVSFCDTSEGDFLRDIERTIGEEIPVREDHPYHCAAAIPPRRPARSSSSRGGGARKSGGGGRGGRRRGGRGGRGGGRPGEARGEGGGRSGGGRRGGRGGRSGGGRRGEAQTSGGSRAEGGGPGRRRSRPARGDGKGPATPDFGGR